MRKLVLVMGLAALVLSVGCIEVKVIEQDEGACLAANDLGGLKRVPCSWCRHGAGVVNGQLCQWDKKE